MVELQRVTDFGSLTKGGGGAEQVVELQRVTDSGSITAGSAKQVVELQQVTDSGSIILNLQHVNPNE